MPRIDEAEYFRERARHERAIAEAARDERIARAHLRLAEEYERKAAVLDAEKSGKS